MDVIDLAEILYEDNRIDYGDGEFAWETSKDEAGEIIRCLNARQDALEDFERDLWTDRDNAIRFSDQGQVSGGNDLHSPPHHPTRDVARELMDSVARGVITGVITAIAVKGINWVINCIIDWVKPNDTSGNSGDTSIAKRLDRLEEGVAELRGQVDELNAILSNISLPKVA